MKLKGGRTLMQEVRERPSRWVDCLRINSSGWCRQRSKWGQEVSGDQTSCQHHYLLKIVELLGEHMVTIRDSRKEKFVELEAVICWEFWARPCRASQERMEVNTGQRLGAWWRVCFKVVLQGERGVKRQGARNQCRWDSPLWEGLVWIPFGVNRCREVHLDQEVKVVRKHGSKELCHRMWVQRVVDHNITWSTEDWVSVMLKKLMRWEGGQPWSLKRSWGRRWTREDRSRFPGLIDRPRQGLRWVCPLHLVALLTVSVVVAHLLSYQVGCLQGWLEERELRFRGSLCRICSGI